MFRNNKTKKMKIIEAIKFTGTNLNDIFKLECVNGLVKDSNDELFVFLKPNYTEGSRTVNKGDYLCKFANGMWQVSSPEEYMNELKK